MAVQNTISRASGNFTIDPGASGDSYIQFNIATGNEFRIGVDDTDNDSFVVSQGNALGTTNTLRISAAGEINKPLQPAFLIRTTVLTNVTGDGTVYTILWNSTIYDITSDYSSATGAFTASIDGKYRFNLSVWINLCNNVAYTSSYTEIVTSNRTYRTCIYNPFLACTQDTSSGQGSNSSSVLADMDAADTCTTRIMVSNFNKTVGVNSVSATALRGYFAGALKL